jgi:hypothetical protein
VASCFVPLQRLKQNYSKVGRTRACVKTRCLRHDAKKEHNWNEWDYENCRTPVWVMMLTSVLSFLSRVLMLVLTQLVCGRPKALTYMIKEQWSNKREQWIPFLKEDKVLRGPQSQGISKLSSEWFSDSWRPRDAILQSFLRYNYRSRRKGFLGVFGFQASRGGCEVFELYYAI